ncbi:MAG: phage minor head protein, partial [Dysosmobacter welbionis]
GTTKTQFQENMDRFLEERGYDGLTPYHADRIFRQNMLTAYSVGHYQQMTDPDVMGRRRYGQYQTAGDRHVRESHAAMDGRVFPADSPVWDIWYPPNGFGCRCMVVSRTEEQVRRMGLTVEQTLPDTSNPATGETDMRADQSFDEPGEGGVEAGPGRVPAGFKEAVWGTAEGA